MESAKTNNRTITVFIGNIMEQVPDSIIRALLSTCGHVFSWKRVIGFGFYEMSIDSSLRVLRLLHNKLVGEKRLIIRVDAKNQKWIDEYNNRKTINASKLENPNFTKNNELKQDEEALLKIDQILKKCCEKFTKNFNQLKENENDLLIRMNSTYVLEENKGDLIKKEIGKFRKNIEKQEINREMLRQKYKHEQELLKIAREKDKENKADKFKENSINDKEREGFYEIEKETKKRRYVYEDINKRREREEELKERKIENQIARQKEESYQKRLRAWKYREFKKFEEKKRNIEKDKMKGKEKKSEIKKLIYFLKNYVDERDDRKYYKGRELKKRLKERFKEAEFDHLDRIAEKDEIEQLKNEKCSQIQFQKNDNLINDKKDAFFKIKKNFEENLQISNEIKKIHAKIKNKTMRQQIYSKENNDYDNFESTNKTETIIQFNVPKNYHRNIQNNLKEDSLKISSPCLSMENSKQQNTTILSDNKNATNQKSTKIFKNHTDKYNYFKQMFDNIPTEKSTLFQFQFDRNSVDNQLMETRLKPWINKKIIQYIGEPEDTLVDFICSKVLTGSSPQDILNDLQVILDEDAEMFVVKMWRLLIYEVEVRKNNLIK